MRRKRICLAASVPLIFSAANTVFGAADIQNSVLDSTNWSGYGVTAPSGQAFTDISSTFVVPAVQAPSSGSTFVADWVGFDGLSNGTVEQCGIDGEITSHGSTTYFAWFEFAPAASIPISGLTIHPGDTVKTEVTYQPSLSTSGHFGYTFLVDDVTTGVSFDQTEFTSSNDARSSAEWIAEAPTVSGSQSSLAGFGSTTFSNDVAALNGGSDQSLGSFGSTSISEVEMIQSGRFVALPTSIGSGGQSFAVNYTGAGANLIWNNANAANPTDGKTWDLGTTNNWNSGSATTIFAGSSNVTFNDSNNGHYAVTLNATVTPGSVTVNNSSGNYTISGTGTIGGTGSLSKTGTGTLTLSTANSYTGGTFVSAGVLQINSTGSSASALPFGPLVITGGTARLTDGVTAGSQSSDPPATSPASNVNLTSLAISGSGRFDLSNNHIIINYNGQADPISSVAALIASGYAGGAWNGPGIMSTDAQSNSGTYGIGYADAADPGNPAGLAPGQIEVSYTLLGDANLDGKVNGTDFAILALDFNQAGLNWDQGDFNYDHKVDGTDFAELATNFNQGANQSATAALESFAAVNGLFADVPEPSWIGLVLISGIGAIARRRRKIIVISR